MRFDWSKLIWKSLTLNSQLKGNSRGVTFCDLFFPEKNHGQLLIISATTRSIPFKFHHVVAMCMCDQCTSLEMDLSWEFDAWMCKSSFFHSAELWLFVFFDVTSLELPFNASNKKYFFIFVYGESPSCMTFFFCRTELLSCKTRDEKRSPLLVNVLIINLSCIF